MEPARLAASKQQQLAPLLLFRRPKLCMFNPKHMRWDDLVMDSGKGVAAADFLCPHNLSPAPDRYQGIYLPCAST